jgi:hypothetical protein
MIEKLIVLIQKGFEIFKENEKRTGYYYSSGVMTYYGESHMLNYSVNYWGLALIGKFGSTEEAYRRFAEMYSRLPESNPGCLRNLLPVAILLEMDFKTLVEIQYNASAWGLPEEADKAVAEFAQHGRDFTGHPDRRGYFEQMNGEGYRSRAMSVVG